MGFFAPPSKANYYSKDSPIRSHPDLTRRRSPQREPETPDEPPKEEKKVPKVRNRERFDPTTSKNTRFNSLIYHTSNDSVDLYAKENDSSDLLGRIYYDDFDSESSTPMVSVNTTPLISPSGSVIGNDYFSRPVISPNKSASTTNLRLHVGSNHHSAASTPHGGGLAAVDEKLRDHSKLSRGVTFDTSTNIERISLTLKAKHPKFKFRRNNKTYFVGYSKDNESLKALEWLFDEMLINGDTVVIIQALDEKLHHDIDRDACNKELEVFQDLNVHDKKIAMVYEIVIGKPQRSIQRAIDEYAPQMMVMGLHVDERELKGLFAKTTISKYFLQYALVPVIVVKPNHGHVIFLDKPIDNEDYFKNWLGDIDISDTFNKDKDRKKKKRPGKSPLNSRSSSLLSLPTLSEERGRPRAVETTEGTKPRFLISGSRSPSASREPRSDSKSSQKKSSLSKFFHR